MKPVGRTRIPGITQFSFRRWPSTAEAPATASDGGIISRCQDSQNPWVQFIASDGRVIAGHINETQDGLTKDAEDVTDNAVQAVAEYVIQQFDGALQVDYSDGTTYQIQVAKIGQPDPTTGMRYGLHPGGEIVGH